MRCGIGGVIFFGGGDEVAIAKSLPDKLSNNLCCQIKNECIIWHGAYRAVDHAI